MLNKDVPFTFPEGWEDLHVQDSTSLLVRERMNKLREHIRDFDKLNTMIKKETKKREIPLPNPELASYLAMFFYLDQCIEHLQDFREDVIITINDLQ